MQEQRGERTIELKGNRLGSGRKHSIRHQLLESGGATCGPGISTSSRAAVTKLVIVLISSARRIIWNPHSLSAPACKGRQTIK